MTLRMSARARWWALLGAVLVVSMTLGIYMGRLNRETLISDVNIPQAAVAHFFTTQLSDSLGTPQALAQWQGKPLVINFWATWCSPCREEMPAFSRLQEKHAVNGVQFVGIALDTPENVATYLKQVHVSYPLLMAESEGMELTQQLGNSRLALPYTVVLDATGKPRLTHLGKVPEQELDVLLEKIALRN